VAEEEWERKEGGLTGNKDQYNKNNRATKKKRNSIF